VTHQLHQYLCPKYNKYPKKVKISTSVIHFCKFCKFYEKQLVGRNHKEPTRRKGTLELMLLSNLCIQSQLRLMELDYHNQYIEKH
jgi:hypothetical protein